MTPSGSFRPSSSSAGRSGTGQRCQKPASLPASFMLRFSLQCDCIWQELSASQPAAILSCRTAIPGPDAARKVPLGPNQSRLFHRPVPCGMVMEGSTWTPRTGKLMPGTRRGSCKYPELPQRASGISASYGKQSKGSNTESSGGPSLLRTELGPFH